MNWYGYEQIFGPWCAMQTFRIVRVEQCGETLGAWVAESGDEPVGLFHFRLAMAHRYFDVHYAIFASSALAYPINIPTPNLYQGVTEGPSRAGNALHPFPSLGGNLIDYMLLTDAGHLNVASFHPPTFEFIGARKTIPCIEAPTSSC